MSEAGTTRRWKIVRAIERGDPRLGIVIGVAVTVVFAFLFIRLVPLADSLEFLALDLAFKRRAPIRESEKVLIVDMDDNSLKKLRWPMPREYYAQVVAALDRLGARQIVFDVEFKMLVPRPEEYDPDTGDFRLSPEDRILRGALARSGKALLAYHFDLEDALPAEVRARFALLRSAFEANIGAGPEEAAAKAGLPVAAVKDRLEAIRDEAVVSLIVDRLRRNPALTFRQVRDEFLPKYDAVRQKADLGILHYAYWTARGRARVLSQSFQTHAEGLPPRARPVEAIVPPFYPFLEKAAGSGFVNAAADADGVMRRPWTHLHFDGRPYSYLGLESALKEMAGPGESVEAVLRPGALEIRVVPASSPESARTTLLPLDEEGRLLVNWAGNHARWRDPRDSDLWYFSHLSFLQLVSFYQQRYETLDANVRRVIGGVPSEERPPEYREYLALSDRLGAALRGETGEGDGRREEARMDEIRRPMMKGMEEEVAEYEAALARNPSPRIRRDTEAKLARVREILAGFGESDRTEAELRKRVEGRICLIGSASTASGDLHPTPLAKTTPGMDILANVTNMALTGQVMRRAPAWIGLAYLLGVGIGVSVVVSHWHTTASAFFTAGVMALTGIVYFALFSQSLLVPGAGPVFTALAAFGGVTAYKELVTQRSKRKLQKELEKNTSAELVTILMEHPEFLAKPRKMTGTFFFSDVKSFTSMSEKMAPAVLVPYINRYLDRMTQSLKRHEAFLDKYIGDGIMALFGIPVPSPHHARDACRAALENQALLKDLNLEFEREGLPLIKTRIGIHSGDVIAGYVGAENRSDYTVLGDNVNLASRLEGANKEYESSVMISEATWDLVAGQFVVRELDRIRVVGKQNAVRIFELVAPAGEMPPFDARFLPEYEAAMAAFKERRWAEAVEGFERALALKPGDRPCETYLSRSHGFQLSPPPPGWEGVFELTSK